MTRKLRRNYSLSVVVPFVAILILSIAAAVLAQTSSAGQTNGGASAVLAPAGTSALARAQLPPSPGNGAGGSSVVRSHEKRQRVRPMDLIPPSFRPAVIYDSGGAGVPSLAVADLRGKGALDLVVGSQCESDSNCGQGGVGVLLGNGDGTFQPPATYGNLGYDVTSVAIGVLNNSGYPDLVAATMCPGLYRGECDLDYGYVAVLMGNGDGTFSPLVYELPWGPGAYGASLALGDLRSNGLLDLVVGLVCLSECGNNSVLSVMLNNGVPFVAPGNLYDSGCTNAWGTTYSVAIGDLNGDGKPDLAAASQCYGGGTVGVLLGNGDGTFQSVTSYNPGGANPLWVAIGDVNGDGIPDLVVANEDSNSVGVLIGNGDGTFQPAVTYSSGGQNATSVVIADMNGDGIPDLVVANEDSNSVGVLIGNGDGTFQPAVTFDSGGVGAYSVAVADVNGDGKLDVLVANCSSSACGTGDGNVGVLLNNTQYTPIPSATALTSSLNPSNAGQNVTFTASVSAETGTPTGMVAFFNGSLLLGNVTLARGTASVSTSQLSGGDNSIVARYQGDGRYIGSVSAPLNQIVIKASTATSLLSSLNPVPLKEYVTYTATVTTPFHGGVTGSVSFQDGGVTVTTVTLSGSQAAYTTNYTAVGTHTITATYSGDAYNAGSTSAPLVEQVIEGVGTKTVVRSSGSPSMVGQAVTFTAKVTAQKGAIPNGEVMTFYEGTALMGTGTIASGVATFTTSSLPAGTDIIEAVYGGDSQFQPSTGKVAQVVHKYSTTTALTSSLNPSQYGQSVTFTAQVTSSGPAPTGKVTFKDGTKSLKTVLLSGGVATVTTSKLSVGTHAITARYSGDAYDGTSTSPVVEQVVQ